MKPDFISNWNVQLKKGLLLYLVMHIIKKKNSYGQEIIAKIETSTGISLAEGTLYPLLKKLKEEQCVLSKWELNNDNAPRKYYYLTGKGGILLKEMDSYWQKLNNDVVKLITS